jgi:hypothetical protein
VTALVIVAVFSQTTSAQSTISGQVTDVSGAAIPGVRVEGASPALIEGSRTGITSTDGRYAIVDVRPGTYIITFTIDGFATLKREVEVRADVTVPVDAEMKIGPMEETIQVSRTAPLVDVQNATHTDIMTRDIVDALPTARNLQSLGSYAPGVHLNIPDVGGSQQIQQAYMTTHGNPAHHDVVLLDGLVINASQNDGQVQTYVDNELIQEITYSTSANSVQSPAGGVFANIVPKDGGNTFRGDSFGAFTPASFVGHNLDANLLERGVSAQAQITQIQDFDGSFGGPVQKDKLWFLVSGRRQRTWVQSPLCKDTDGSPCVERDHINTGHSRLTYQLSPRNKLSAMFMREAKKNDDEVVTNAVIGTGVPATVSASSQRNLWMLYIAQAKWTAIASPKLLLEAGFSINKTNYNVAYQGGLTQVPFSNAWYSNVLLLDTVSNLRYNVSTQQNFFHFDRQFVQASGSYVTGRHQIRFGLQDSFGRAYQDVLVNGDLYAVETNGVPTSVTVFDTPITNRPYLNADLGLFAQDTWTLNRLTITPGIRWEYLSNQINPETASAGRFVPARSFPAVTCDTYPGISCFKNWVPRLSAVYDVFGSHKTALKVSIGKFNTPLVQGNLNAFNPLFVTTQSRAWVNAGGCTGPSCFPTDDQIGPAPSGSFGILTPRSMDPSHRREYNVQYTAGIQQQLAEGLALNFTYIRRDDYQQTMTINQAVPASAWTPVTITNPLDGSPITVYNLDPAYVGITPQLYQTNAPRSIRSDSYNGFDTTFQARFRHGGFLSAGWTVDRERTRYCDQTIGGNSLSDPNSLRYCDWYGELFQELGATGSIPFRNGFKLQGNVPLWYGFEFSFSLYSNPAYNTNFALNNQASVFPTQINPEPIFAGAQQGFKEVYWTLTPSTRYPNNCNCSTPGAVVDRGLAQGAETILLVPPSSRLTPQLTQFDIAIRHWIPVGGGHRVKVEAQVFNVLNSNVVTAEAQTLGASITPFVSGGIGGVPSAILNPRMLRLAAQFSF